MNDLLVDGYYIGNAKEVVLDWAEFENQTNRIPCLTKDKQGFIYRYSIKDREGKNFPNMPDQIPVIEIPARRKFVKENNAKVCQQWFESAKVTGELRDIMIYLRHIVNVFIVNHYPELNLQNIDHNDSISIYEDGDFIESHNDGENKGRVCVVLLYLSDPLGYNNGGGKLIINSKKQEVLPVRGNYTILDFTKNNIEHAVEPVKNGFKRFCYITFIYNKDKK